MRARYGAIGLAGGMLAAAMALSGPAAAENPMTPLRPAEPAKSAYRAPAASEPAAVSVPSAPAATAPAAAAAQAPPSIPAAPAMPMPGPASSAMPETANIADADASAPPRARRGSRRDRAAGVKPGRWEFTARLRTPATPAASIPASASALQPAAGGMPTSYTTCIESGNAVPADLGPQCRLDRRERRGSRIAWSMSCANTGVRSDGLAQYRGDTMQATIVSHIPGPAGKTTDMTQHIDGRYLGPCSAVTQAQAAGAAAMPPNGPAAAANLPQPSAVSPPSVAEPAASPPAPPTTGATPTAERTAADTAAPEASPEREARGPRRSRSGRHMHRRHRHHYAGRGAYRSWYGAAATGFGPNPYSGSGP